jgi:hypothetical protein
MLITNISANGHHQLAQTATAQASPPNDTMTAAFPTRARLRTLSSFCRSSAREPARAPSSLSRPPRT